MDIIANLKEYKRLKTSLSREYGKTPQQIQQAIEMIAQHILAKEGEKTITSAEIVTLATPEDSILHDMFDWTKTQQDRENAADELIQSTSVFLSSNKFYTFTKQ
jgi:hypothetical protein